MRTHSLLHLVQGDHAGNRLRFACRNCGLAGRVKVIGEDLSHGPLDDGHARIRYMRLCYRGYDTWTFRRPDAFAPWRQLLRLISAGARMVTVWSSDRVSDQVFLAMACRWLADVDVSLSAVIIPPVESRHGVGMATAEMLASLYSRAVELGSFERATRAAAFDRVGAPGVLLRRLEDGTLRPIPLDHYDRFVGDAVDVTWRPAERVVATAMARCNRNNPMSDVFFASRLQRLIAVGEIEVAGARGRLADYRVRTADRRSGHSAGSITLISPPQAVKQAS